MTRNELKELQMLMSTEPEDLSDEQKIRLIDLKGLFEKTMPANTSPLPTTRTGEERPLATTPASSSTCALPSSTPASSSTTAFSTNFNKQPKSKVKTKDQETQTDVPAFQRVESAPPVHTRVVAGPFHQVEGRDVIHVYENCWGLRNAGRKRMVNLCRCCVENGGNRIY